VKDTGGSTGTRTLPRLKGALHIYEEEYSVRQQVTVGLSPLSKMFLETQNELTSCYKEYYVTNEKRIVLECELLIKTHIYSSNFLNTGTGRGGCYSSWPLYI
jgi:hypothetical protein